MDDKVYTVEEIEAFCLGSLPADQQLAFEQPNIAVLRFPYVLLPGIVVPLVGLSHLLHLKQLLTQPDPQATPILSETVDS